MGINTTIDIKGPVSRAHVSFSIGFPYLKKAFVAKVFTACDKQISCGKQQVQTECGQSGRGGDQDPKRKRFGLKCFQYVAEPEVIYVPAYVNK